MTFKSPALVVVDYLIDQTAVPAGDFVDSDSVWGTLVFRDGLPLDLAASGKRAVMVTSGTPGLTSSHAYSSSVSVRCYADHTRDPDTKQASVEDGTDRAWSMMGKVDFLLENPSPLANGDPFIQSNRASDPLESFDQDQNMPYIVATYAVSILASK